MVDSRRGRDKFQDKDIRHHKKRSLLIGFHLNQVCSQIIMFEHDSINSQKIIWAWA